METEDIMEGNYLNVKIVNKSSTKKCLIIGAGAIGVRVPYSAELEEVENKNEV